MMHSRIQAADYAAISYELSHHLGVNDYQVTDRGDWQHSGDILSRALSIECFYPSGFAIVNGKLYVEFKAGSAKVARVSFNAYAKHIAY